MEVIGILPKYNTMKCHLQSMSGTLLGRHAAKCQLQFKINFRYLTHHKMSATINKCLVSYLEMLRTYPIACRCT